MLIAKRNKKSLQKLKIDNVNIQQVHKFTSYLGSIVSSDSKCVFEIKNRMVSTKSCFQNIKPLLTRKIKNLVFAQTVRMYISEI